MSITKDELRAEIATIREELAAERARAEVLRLQAAGHDCHGCAHAGWVSPYTQPSPYQPGLTWPVTIWTSQPCQVTCGDPSVSGGAATTTLGYVTTNASTLS